MSDLRVEAIGFPGYYCAVYRRDGIPDRLLDGADGRPEQFPSAWAAVQAGKAALVQRRDADAPFVGADPLGVETWLADRDAAIAAERHKVFGPDQPRDRGGRTFVVERRRRR
ncbi:hypothetical protein [Aminobacter carboxidus]|uniref:Uncharacterized protein n=1 Tax=Aminobacter carboxidus TaxID=376165 RepID=A0ABR9GWQ9_9HYPH|nr:hypothetical protein [Aminobacter carboxidus]MBE1208130.1 hypothetical protein [Aminobacter carboxidus]